MGAAVLAFAVTVLGPLPVARADFGVVPGSFQVTPSTTQAGAHPDLDVSFALNVKTGSDGLSHVDENLRDLRVDLPAGIVGNPLAATRCTISELEQRRCPASSQVGIARMDLLSNGFVLRPKVAVVNVVPRDGVTAQLAFIVLAVSARPEIGVRPGDYGLTTTLTRISTDGELSATGLSLWGVPADPVHDPYRNPTFLCFAPDLSFCAGPGLGAGVTRRPFLTNPTHCGGDPLVAGLTVDSWQHPDRLVDETATLPPTTGCDKLHFEPSISVAPDTTRAGSPAGYRIRIDVPQNQDADGLATAELKDAVVTLPTGATLSPSVAKGLRACSDEQLDVTSSDEPTCPRAAKIGEVTLTTPVLPDQLTGDIYIGKATTTNPYRIFIVMRGDGVMIKLRGSVHPDPVTGQLTTSFLDSPMQPFSRLELRFKGGDHAPLTTPAQCGPATTTTLLTPWSAPFSGDPATPSDSFVVSWDGAGASCPSQLAFTPALSAGVTSTTAGASSPFVFHLTRPDRQQALSTISNVHLPGGLLADVTKVGRCTGSAAASGDCPADSQVGEALTSAGPGADPLQLPGKVYLTDGYKSAPFGLSIVVPAVAGPYDLGTVVVRAAVRVNNDASLSVDADPLPTILEGIPLQLRDIALTLDRPGFMQSPTNCEPMAVTARIGSQGGASVDVADRFQLSDCASLGFAPKIEATTRAGNNNTRGASLQVAVSGRHGDANLRKVVFTLPKQMGPRLSTLSSLCTMEQFQHAACPDATRMGTATAVTPILPEPLSGPVYLVGQDKALPKLMIPLNGNGIAITLTGDVTIARGRTSTTFDNIPDVAIKRFELDLPMGPRSLLSATGDVCDTLIKAPTAALGQNGRTLTQSTTVHAVGCPLRIAKATASGRTARVRVSGLVAGRLEMSGPGVRTVRVKVGSSAVRTLTVRLTNRGARRLAHQGALRVKLRAVLRHADGTLTSASRTLTFQRHS